MTAAHPNARLEALCDGVFAIALTLLILDVKLPPADSIASTSGLWRALQHLAPSVFAFVTGAALKGGLYSLLAVTALWFPFFVAAVTMLSWTFWLVLGIRMKHA